jgi:hypothetical protein
MMGIKLKNTRRGFFYLFMVWMSVMVGGSVYAEKLLVAADQEIVLGEHLVYKITWLRIPVGVGELWVKEKAKLGGRDIIHVVGSIKTNKVLSKILPMHDEAQSWIDAETYESVQFEKKIDELLTRAHEKVVFDSGKKKGYYESFKTGERKEFSISVPVHDVFSAFYWARRQRLEVGKQVRIVLSADQVDWALEINGLFKETLKIQHKKIETVRIGLDTRSGGKDRRGMAWFNLTEDAARKPVRIVYKAPFGSVVGTLLETSRDLR